MKEEVAKKALEWMEGTEDFVLEQAPKIIHEVLLFEFYQHLLALVFGATVIILSVWWCNRQYNFYKNAPTDTWGNIEDDSEDWFIMSLIISAILDFISLLIFFEGLLEVIKISLAPRLFLIEYFKGFVS